METVNISRYILNALADALGNDKAEPESLCTFLIYMQLGVIKAAYPSIEKASIKAAGLLSYLNQTQKAAHEIKTNEERYKNIKLLFDNNHDTLLEIIEEIWDTNAYATELNWMNTWETGCRQFLKDRDFNQGFVDLSQLVYEQTRLGDISSSCVLLINSFIQLSRVYLSNSKIIRIA